MPLDPLTSPSTNGPRKAVWLSLGLVLLFAITFHGPVLFQNKTVSAFDFAYFHMPAYRGERPPDVTRPSNALQSDPVIQLGPWDKALYEGMIPFPWLWNPYSGCGSPMLANSICAAFYPLQWLAFAGGVIKGFGYLCLLKMLLAGVFMWIYLHAIGIGAPARALGALAFMASGFMVAWLQWPQTNVALLLPMAFLACEWLLSGRLRPGMILLAVVVTLSLLAGHPESAFHLAFISGLYFLFGLFLRGAAGSAREDAASQSRAPHLFRGVRMLFADPTWRRAAITACAAFALAGVVGALMAAFQLLPTAEYIWHSCALQFRQQAMHLDIPWTRFWGFGWEYAHRELISYLLPDTWGNPAKPGGYWNEATNYNESAGYTGVGVLLLAVSAWGLFACDRRVRILCLLQLLSLGFILNTSWMLNTIGHLPVFDVAVNKRLLMVFCFANAALAAIVLDTFIRRQKLGTWFYALMAAAATLFLAAAGHDYVTRFLHHPDAWIPPSLGRRQLFLLLAGLLPFLLAMGVPARWVRARTVLGWCLVVVAGADLMAAHYGYNPFIKRYRVYPETAAIRFLKAAGPMARVLPIGSQIWPNICMVYGLQDPRLYDALVVTNYGHYLYQLAGRPDRDPSILMFAQEPDVRLAAAASVNFLWGRHGWQPKDTNGCLVCYEDDDTTIYQVTNAFPRAFVAAGWQPASSAANALDLLQQPGTPWQTMVAIEPASGPASDRAAAGQAGSVPVQPATITEYQAERVAIDVPADAAGLLVLNDTWYPGWRARVDGQSRPIYRVNGTFRGVFVEKGERQVVFEFKPLSFRAGLGLSLVGLLGLVWAVRKMPEG